MKRSFHSAPLARFFEDPPLPSKLTFTLRNKTLRRMSLRHLLRMLQIQIIHAAAVNVSR